MLYRGDPSSVPDLEPVPGDARPGGEATLAVNAVTHDIHPRASNLAATHKVIPDFARSLAEPGLPTSGWTGHGAGVTCYGTSHGS
jgi:hypothetical protein